MEQMFHRYETKSACRFRTGFLFVGARFPYRPKVVFAVHDAGCVPTHSSFYNWHNNNRFIFRLIRKSQVDGSCRALGRCLIKGRNKISVSGSNQACIVIMFVLTIPGSEAFMVMPWFCSRSASSWVNNNNASLVLL